MPEPAAVAVLTSGGLDSAILVAQLAHESERVVPLYVRFGLVWEDAEYDHLARFLAALPPPRPDEAVVLATPVADVYGSHWSVTGRDVPDDATPDEAVYLPGRNLLLLAKASVWCALNDVGTIALGTLAANPFPDADAEFFAGFSALASRALGTDIRVVTPFAGRTKSEVLEAGRGLPLELTFSCIDPKRGRHCGRCNKCAERQKAFTELGLADRTEYALS
jgi:7-cyano-7-deazaguanine synthase